MYADQFDGEVPGASGIQMKSQAASSTVKDSTASKEIPSAYGGQSWGPGGDSQILVKT